MKLRPSVSNYIYSAAGKTIFGISFVSSLLLMPLTRKHIEWADTIWQISMIVCGLHLILIAIDINSSIGQNIQKEENK